METKETNPIMSTQNKDLLFDLMSKSAIAEMARKCYEESGKRGFRDGPPRSTLELCMLVVTELAELAEWERNNKPMSDHLPGFTGAEEEWADVLIRTFDHAVDMGITPERLGEAFVAKMHFNSTRSYRHGGKSI